MTNILTMQGITKNFPGTKALDKVYFNLEKGIITGLLGENGAGKSTLMKILVGAMQPDMGKIYFNGVEEKILSPKHAKAKDIHIIYQELELLPKLTVAENIVFPDFPKKNCFLDWKLLYNFTQDKLNSLNIKINSHARIKELSVAEQQLIAITRAISSNCKILILDEPTSALTDRDINILFEVLRKLKAKEVGIVFITHKLEEIKEITDKVTILRDGKVVGSDLNTRDISVQELANLIVGKEFKEKYPQRKRNIGEEKIRLENINYKEFIGNRNREIKNINLTIKKGEIVGVIGLLGAGKTEISKVIFSSFSGGAKISGNIYLDGHKVNFNSPNDAIRFRIGQIPENRVEALFLKQDVKFNISIDILDRLKRKNGLLDLKREKELMNKIKKNLDIKFASVDQNINSLSGGNKQKVLVSRCLIRSADLLILDEPTRGIDVGAKVELYKLINELAENGVAILLLSSEAPEVLGMSDRIYILKNGIIAKEVSYKDISLNELNNLILVGDN